VTRSYHRQLLTWQVCQGNCVDALEELEHDEHRGTEGKSEQANERCVVGEVHPERLLLTSQDAEQPEKAEKDSDEHPHQHDVVLQYFQ